MFSFPCGLSGSLFSVVGEDKVFLFIFDSRNYGHGKFNNALMKLKMEENSKMETRRAFFPSRIVYQTLNWDSTNSKTMLVDFWGSDEAEDADRNKKDATTGNQRLEGGNL
eukprot:Sdes_comp15919_c0_seq1m5051